MRVLVTGGFGFLGSGFVRYSAARYPGFKFVVFDALTYAAKPESLADLSSRIRFEWGDVRSFESLSNAARDADLIVHFAAESHNDNSLVNPRLFVETNVMGTLNVLELSRLLGKHVHIVSTDEVFGSLQLTDSELFQEGSNLNPSSPYSSSKAAGDLLARAWARSFNADVSWSNCTNNYGLGQHDEKLIPTLIRQGLNGGPFKLYGDGLNVRDWIHVDDHSSAVWAIIESGVRGSGFCVSAQNELSNLEVANVIKTSIGEDISIEFIDDRPGHDRRYALDPSRLIETTGWRPERTDFRREIDDLVQLARTSLSSSRNDAKFLM